MEDDIDFAAALAAINPWMPVDVGDQQACFFCGARRRRDHFAECLWSKAYASAYQRGRRVPPRVESGSHWHRD